MTQFIESRKGKTYALKHLRPFDLELAKQGHPLACQRKCSEVAQLICIREKIYVAVRWAISGWFVSMEEDAADLTRHYRLAPLAIKDGKPLHMGDWIEVNLFATGGKWVECDWTYNLKVYENLNNWRWPAEAIK